MRPTTHQPDVELSLGAVQRGALVGLVALAGVIGTWSYFWPRHFFEHFPVVVGAWIAQDGPFNEHLACDHGAMYLALGAASAYGLIRGSQAVYRVTGIAWTVFGTLHVAYHAGHLGQLATAQAVSQAAALIVALALGVAVMIPGRPRRLETPHAHPRVRRVRDWMRFSTVR